MLEIFGEVGAKMGPRWTQDGPSWQQVAPKMGHVSAKMAMLGSFWEALAEFWKFFWSILVDALDIKKHTKNILFKRFLEVWLFWAMLTPRYFFLVDAGAMLRHVGGKMATKSAKMRQHRRKRAPRLARLDPVAASQEGLVPFKD